MFGKKLIGVALVLGALVPSMAGAQSTSDLQAQIASLMAQIQQLQAQLAQQQGGGEGRWCHVFNTDLTVGAVGTEVSALENALAREGYSVQRDSNVTTNFDEDTAAAVVQFQAKYGIRQTGYVGPITRAKLNSLYGCGDNAQSPSIGVSPETISSGGTASFSIASPQAVQSFKLSLRCAVGLEGQASVKGGLGCNEFDAGFPSWGSATSLIVPVQFTNNSTGSLVATLSAALFRDANYHDQIGTVQKEVRVLSAQSTSTINPAPRMISLVYPSAGTAWEKNTTKTIQWNSTGVSRVYLKLRKNSYGDTVRAIADVMPNQGSYAWSIPNDLPSGNDYVIRVLSGDGLVIGDSSPFSIGDSVIPTPTSSTGSAISFAGYSWTPLYVTFGNNYANGYGNWRVDGDGMKQETASSLHYKIVARSMAPLSDYDVQAVVRFRSGSEIGLCGRMDDNGRGYCLTTAWGGGTALTLSAFANADQDVNYMEVDTLPQVPITQNTDYVIKMRFQGNQIFGKAYPAGSAEPDWMTRATDNRFASGKIGFYSYAGRPIIKSVSVNGISITPQPTITVTSPNGGETWQTGSQQNVSFRVDNTASGFVALELYRLNDPSFAREITPLAFANSSPYKWTIPTDLVGGSYTIKATYFANVSSSPRTIFDSSDAPFTIVSGATSTILISCTTPGAVKVGDFNRDGAVTIGEVQKMASFSIGTTPTADELKIGDGNGDNRITTVDVNIANQNFLGGSQCVAGPVVVSLPITISAPATVGATVGQLTSFSVTATPVATLTSAPIIMQGSNLPSGARFLRRGDVNRDGAITQVDSVMILRFSLGTYQLDAEQRILADVDGNGSVEKADSDAVLNSLLTPPLGVMPNAYVFLWTPTASQAGSSNSVEFYANGSGVSDHKTTTVIVASGATSEATSTILISCTTPGAVKVGDFDRDGSISLAELSRMASINAGATPTADELKIGDGNGDGRITTADITIATQNRVGGSQCVAGPVIQQASVNISPLAIGTAVYPGTLRAIVGQWRAVGSGSALLRSITFRLSGTAAKSDIRNVMLMVDGVQLGATVSSIGTDGAIPFSFSSPVLLGNKNLQLYADVFATPGTNFQLGLNASDVTASSNDGASANVTVGGTGTTVNVVSALSTTLNVSLSNPTYNIGSPSVKIGSYVFYAAGEDISVNTMTIAMGQDGSKLQNVKLIMDNVQYGVTQPIVQSNQAYSFAGALVIPANSSKIVDVYADVPANASAGVYPTITRLSGCSAVGNRSFTALSCGPVSGQSIVVVGTTSTASSTQASNATPQQMASILDSIQFLVNQIQAALGR